MLRKFHKLIPQSQILSSRPFYAFSTTPKVRIIQSHSNNIFWNLATEEYLFESSDLDIPTLFLYRQDKTIIIGRHQNPHKECFLQEINKDNVVLCRRKSGGGAVFQDLGNTCFSFLTPMHLELNPDKVKDQNNQILLNALKQLGVEASASGRNDIVVQEKKISGSAFKLNLGKSDGTGKKHMHHGTMLINVDLDVLQKYLNPNKQKLLSKGITSIRSRVENLVNLNPLASHETVSQAIIGEFKGTHFGCDHVVVEYTETDMQGIPEVRTIYEEMTSWEWLYQKTPDFTNQMETRFPWGVVDVMVEVKGNSIISGKVFSDSLHPDFIDAFNETLQTEKVTYDENGIRQLCNKLREKFPENELYHGFIKDLETWLPTVL